MRVVTSGNDTTNSAARISRSRRAPRETAGRISGPLPAPGRSTWRSRVQPEEQSLSQVEEAGAYHRRDDAQPGQGDDAPARAERGGRQHRCPTLNVVTEPEEYAEAHEPDAGAAEVLLEAVEDERALDLL